MIDRLDALLAVSRRSHFSSKPNCADLASISARAPWPADASTLSNGHMDQFDDRT
jgi:hypothetical protein